VITVVDPDASRAVLAAGRLACPEPGCGGVLRVWSRARARRVRVRGGEVELLRPDRGRCRACGVTHVLLPAWCLPRRAYGTEVVGAALLAAADGAGYARAAAAADAPVGTVRDWLRAVARGAPGLTAQAVTVAEAAADAGACWPRPWRPGSALAGAVNALAAAARAFRLQLARPRPAGPGGSLTGIDYLALVAERHRRSILRRLRLADPTGALAHVSPWQLINVITGGRLLTTPASG
jgi:Domain of unknown function (DUF6431)